MLTDYQLQQLTNQSECYIHTHPKVPLDQSDVAALEAVTAIKITTLPYSLTFSDEHISVSATGTITLPPAVRGKEYHVTLTTAGQTITIVPTGSDTILGDTSLEITIQWTSLHLKADEAATNWVLI